MKILGLWKHLKIIMKHKDNSEWWNKFWIYSFYIWLNGLGPVLGIRQHLLSHFTNKEQKVFIEEIKYGQ